MRKLLLSPKWWGLHLFVLAAVLVMLRLGLWQWHRADSSSGGLQNYAYAFQWPLFAIFALFLWWKTLRIEAAEEAKRLAGEDAESGAEPHARPLSRLAARGLPEPQIAYREGVRVGISTPAPADDDDPEVAAYNAYLARLNERAGATMTRRGDG